MLDESAQSLGLRWQSGRVETEYLGRVVASLIKVGPFLPVLVGNHLQFFGRPPGSIPPPRRHETQLFQLRHPEGEWSGLAVKAHVHHRAFLAALADEAERVPRAGPRELLQPGPGCEPDAVLKRVAGRVRRVEVRDPDKERYDLLVGAQKGQQRAWRGGSDGCI
ncbi:hypothetical protein ABT039_09395 [Streptomyces lasiicapitis]|uniref:hypothetical protein n=1 Tax=Streptomyces lasiicapitis TaxID=1923961 RepID=UPI00332D46BD